MFNETENGQTHFCPLCEERQREIEILKNENKKSMTKLILFILIIVLFAIGLWQIALITAALGAGLAMVEFFEKFNPKG